MTFRPALALMGAFWAAACSFPDYAFVPDAEPVVEPAPDPLVSVCTDGLPSDAETGIDCGGGCPPCGMGQPCREHQHCESRACVSGICQLPACDDNVANGSESDVDCGGQCDPCPPGADCRAAEDCAEGVCADDFCQTPTCSDTVQNGEETDTDCGGESCGPCALGLSCTQGSDCASVHCSEDGVCVSPGCTDGNLNGDETDVDCGGPGCGPCQADKACSVGADCVSTICDEQGRCAAVSCDDQVLNGDEAAVDCGGPSCAGCPNLGPCRDAADCASGACQSGLCVPASPTGTALSRAGWLATASNSYVDDNPNEVLDSEGGRWTSGTSMYDGMWLTVDMGELRTFFSAVLLCQQAELDFPERYDVYLSRDGNFDQVAQGNLIGGPVSEVSFDTAQLARYIRFVVRAPKTKWWSIDELNVYE